MTLLDWKVALLPLGWKEINPGKTLRSRRSRRGLMLFIDLINGTPVPSLSYGGDGYHGRLPMPPDIDTMRALMTGLQIPAEKHP